jgi:hypothetical protein
VANFNLTPEMALPNPIPGVDPGPDYALNLQTALNIIDGHNHASGSGVQINPNGIDINAALPFNGNPATLLGYLGISPQGTGIATPINDSLYCSGVDLYFQDGNGNAVRITSGGTVNATSSGISSGTALATFVSSILVVTQSAGVGAAIDAATYILRYNGSYPSPSGNYILLSAPSSLATGYQITFPAITPGTSGAFLTSNTSGVLSYTNVDGSTLAWSSGTISVAALGVNTAQLANGAVTQPKRAALGQQVSSSSGAFSTSTASSYVAVTNLSVTITTTGRPVYIGLQADGTSNLSFVGTSFSVAYLQIQRDGTDIGNYNIISGGSPAQYAPGFPPLIDTGATSGAHTYTAYVHNAGSGGTSVNYVVLFVYEL